MAQTIEFYDQRAAEARAEAEAATLANVRDRALRSAKSWQELADQARYVAKEREKYERERIARREDEAQAAN
ncbi:hypothetical protein GCM10011371_19120 [Novosphingobium marinum]|uniref:Uncharacterized protein n=1 Tax=Novosphingobium marinum TaxID=1514948 RepID=A0A7Y9XWU3_9SPHN|nr:hypothetical protein [Novosphingobium marinum]NYH96024.1 hypothetical protein [Novosphingobium marinum]GGC31841.1 hypothetical protein GCM10011371_19120 [Novosphingobium marinum]